MSLENSKMMMPEYKREENPCTWFNIRRASRAVTQHFDKVLQPAGLRVSQGRILGLLHFRGASTITDVSECLAMDRTTLSRNLKPLERRGFISLTQGNKDKRSRIISLTEKGAMTLKNAFPYWKQANQRFIKGLGDENWRDLIGLLSRVVDLTRRK